MNPAWVHSRLAGASCIAGRPADCTWPICCQATNCAPAWHGNLHRRSGHHHTVIRPPSDHGPSICCGVRFSSRGVAIWWQCHGFRLSLGGWRLEVKLELRLTLGGVAVWWQCYGFRLSLVAIWRLGLAVGRWDEWPSDAPNWQSGGVTWKSPRDAKPPIPTFPPPTALLQEAEPEWLDSSFASSAQGAVLPSEPEKPEHKAHRERTQKTHATRKVDARHEKPTWAAQRDETRRLETTAKRPPVKELPRGMKLTLAHLKEKTCPRGPGAEALKRKAPEAAPAASAEGIPDPRGPAMVRLKREAPGAAPAASAPAAPAAAEDSIFKKEIAALGGIGMRGFQPPTFWDKQKTSEDKLPNFLLRPPMFARSNTIACRNHWCPFKAQVSNRGPKA